MIITVVRVIHEDVFVAKDRIRHCVGFIDTISVLVNWVLHFLLYTLFLLDYFRPRLTDTG